MSIWQTSQKILGYTLGVLSLLGLLASFTLTFETIESIKNPSYVPTCNISPIVSCGRAISSNKSEVFGIPNPIYGIVAFTALLTFSFTLVAGARYRRWFWLLVESVGLVGVIAAHYLFFVSTAVLGSICPWCSLVWVVTIAVFWYLTTHLVATGVLSVGSGTHKLAEFWKKYATAALVLWYVILIVVVFLRFQEYWLSLL
jgi:uncharacterized membrane protein